MFHILFDFNTLLDTIVVLLLVLTASNYIISINTNRKQRKKLEELEESLNKLHKILS